MAQKCKPDRPMIEPCRESPPVEGMGYLIRKHVPGRSSSNNSKDLNIESRADLSTGTV